MSKTANIRVTQVADADGVNMHSMVIEIGARRIAPPIEFTTLQGLCTLLADLLAEELAPHQRVTEPELPPVP